MENDKQDGKIARIGKYEIVGELGRGGMGVVYRAIDKHIGREVAIKTLTEGFADDPTMLERFYAEGRRTGCLNHPNIVTVYDLGDDNGMPYIVMECVSGETLDAILRSGRPMALADGLQILVEVCTALGYAHQNKVIHRDVKPANIFVQPDGKTKLLDFGIARLEKRDKDQSLTRTGHLIGTVAYMAPERIRGDMLDGRSDLFSAGVVLYQLVTGQKPFTGNDNLVMQRILMEPHPPMRSVRPDCPQALETIVARALAKSPDARYSSGEEMAADLAAVVGEMRHEQAQELLEEARHLAAQQDYNRARNLLHQLLRIDSKHSEARDLLAEVNLYFSQLKREEKVHEVLQQIEEHFHKKQFEQALATLEGNEELLAQHPDFARLKEQAIDAKQRQERVSAQLNVVETARRKGDYSSAIAAAQKASEIDATNSRIVALCALLVKEAGQAQRNAEVRTLLTAARKEVGLQRYQQALEYLRQIEQIDPTNSELVMLQKNVNEGLEQARQRETVARLEERVALASNTEEIRLVTQAIQEAMTAMPAESALYRLHAQVERMAREQENRRLVEEAVRACRDLAPQAALEIVQNARKQLPAEEQLLTLESLLNDRLRQQSAEERRAGFLARAQQALSQQQYGEAVHILESCQAEGIASKDVVSLLEFARNEEHEHRQQSRLRSNVEEAQSRMAAQDYEAAIAFLEDSLKGGEDPSLRLLLEQALAGREAQQQQIVSALAATGRLHSSGRASEALRFLAMQPPAVRQAAQVQETLEVLQDEQQQAVFRAMGRAYATLVSEPATGAAWMRKAAAAGSDPRITSVPFQTRQLAVADSAVELAVQQAKNCRSNHDAEAGAQALFSVAKLLPFASSTTFGSWEQMRKKFSSSVTLASIRFIHQKERASAQKAAKM